VQVFARAIWGKTRLVVDPATRCTALAPPPIWARKSAPGAQTRWRRGPAARYWWTRQRLRGSEDRRVQVGATSRAAIPVKNQKGAARSLKWFPTRPAPGAAPARRARARGG